MRKGCIQNVVVHIPERFDRHGMADKINAFYIEIAERKIKNSGISKNEQADVLDRIMEKMKSSDGML